MSRLRGHVEVTYRGMKLTADEVTYNEASGEVVATGHVLFIDPRSHIVAAEVHYNVRTEVGWFSNANGYIHTSTRPRPRPAASENPYYVQADRSKVLYTQNPLYFQAKEMDRVDEDTYTVRHGRFTTCDCENKGWSFSAGEARLELDDKAIARDSVIRFLGVPIFYFPFVATSIARRPRHTGFLLPEFSNSSIKGTIIGAGFFWAISPSMDLLLGLQNSASGDLPRGCNSAPTPPRTLNSRRISSRSTTKTSSAKTVRPAKASKWWGILWIFPGDSAASRMSITFPRWPSVKLIRRVSRKRSILRRTSPGS